MTHAEFEGEVRRVLVAVGLSADMPIEIRERPASPGLPETFNANIQGDGFQLSINRYASFLRLQIADDMDHLKSTGSVLFQEFNLRLYVSQSQKKHVPLMLRVLLDLGFDVDALCAKAVISAHERLEWSLEGAQERDDHALK